MQQGQAVKRCLMDGFIVVWAPAIPHGSASVPCSVSSLNYMTSSWPNDTIDRIKERVEKKEDIPLVQQRLIYARKQLVDDKAAKDYNIDGGSVLHSVLALRGGIAN